MARTLFHGSIKRVETIDLSLANPKRDFGAGFYTTSDSKQAISFSRIIAKRNGLNKGVVSSFKYEEDGALRVLRFDSANLEWLDFILFNRGFALKEDARLEYDLIVGPVANDQVGQTLNLLITGAYGEPSSQAAREFAISILLTEKLVDQWVFKTQAAIDRLDFIGAEDNEF